jgi:hypothetical protein
MTNGVIETEQYVDVRLDGCLFQYDDGTVLLEEDYRIGGDVWRINKSDSDPWPSDPHAHCIEGKFRGLKLHLGSRKLFEGRRELDMRLDEDSFMGLIELVQPKFPDTTLPLST